MKNNSAIFGLTIGHIFHLISKCIKITYHIIFPSFVILNYHIDIFYMLLYVTVKKKFKQLFYIFYTKHYYIDIKMTWGSYQNVLAILTQYHIDLTIRKSPNLWQPKWTQTERYWAHIDARKTSSWTHCDLYSIYHTDLAVLLCHVIKLCDFKSTCQLSWPQVKSVI